MEALFLHFLNMSITASWLILAVVLLRVLLKKAPKFIRCILWGLVGIRLILPFSFESVLSLIPSANTIPREILDTDTPAIDSGISAVDNIVNPVITDNFSAETGASINSLEIITYIASIVWLIGIVGMLIYSVISYARLHRRVSASINVRDNIYYCDDISTPFILGIIKPKIYLPSGINENQADYVIAHENAHIKRRDHWWKPFGFILLSVYWFNPLIWIAYILLCRDIEMACDEKVIKDMDNEHKAEYSDALVECSTQQRRMIMACPLSFGEVGVKDRIKSVLSYKKPTLWIIIVAIITCIGVTIAFMTNPFNEKNKYDYLETYGYTTHKDVDIHIIEMNLDNKKPHLVVQWENNSGETIYTGSPYDFYEITSSGIVNIEKEKHNPLYVSTEITEVYAKDEIYLGHLNLSENGTYTFNYSFKIIDEKKLSAIYDEFKGDTEKIVIEKKAYLQTLEDYTAYLQFEIKDNKIIKRVTEIQTTEVTEWALNKMNKNGFYMFENDEQSVVMLKKSAKKAYKSYCEVVGNFIHIYYNSVEGKIESNTICNTAYSIDNKYTNDDTTIVVYLDGKISKFKEVIVTDNEILTNCKTENSNSNNGDIMLGKESNMFGRESISERHRRLNNTSYNLENCYETIDNNDETYNYIIKNKNGDILKEFKNVWRSFSIVEVNKRTLKSDYSHGTGYCATSTQYYDVNDSRISEEFFGVIGEYQDKVLYTDFQNSEYYLVVQDIYDKEKFYKKILLKDCPVAADPVTSLEISKNEAIITYLKGNSYRETQEVFIVIDLTKTDNSFDILKMLETERFSFKEDYAQYKNEVGVKTDNFKNVTANDIYFEEDALALAKNEVTVSYNQTKIYYDYEEDYWKINFYTENMLGGDQTVYLDSDGKTVMCVYGE